MSDMANRYRILRELPNGKRQDVPRPAWDSDSTFTYGVSPEHAIVNARNAGATGRLIAVQVDESDRKVVTA